MHHNREIARNAPMPERSHLKIAVIGAGLAGISAARVLQARGHGVTVFEKSRGFGGRCATKRWEGSVVDHGAQYFTLRDERFRAAVLAASGAAIQRNKAHVLNEDGNPLSDSGRWFHRDGNSRLARDLARDLDVKLETTIARAADLLRDAGGEFDHVISTAPLPQTARLCGLDLPNAEYIPCLTVLLRYRGDLPGNTAAAYAISDHSGPLASHSLRFHRAWKSFHAI
jgi:renalase